MYDQRHFMVYVRYELLLILFISLNQITHHIYSHKPKKAILKGNNTTKDACWKSKHVTDHIIPTF
jgi:hypothetical protein